MTQLDMWENSPDRGNSWRKGPKERVFLTCSKEEASVAGGSTGRRGRQRGGGGGEQIMSSLLWPFLWDVGSYAAVWAEG